MTIEAKTTFLGIPVRTRILKIGEDFKYTSYEDWYGNTVPGRIPGLRTKLVWKPTS